MPPRYVYWTIIAGGLPTAFRAAQRDELLPTFRRIHEKHPDAELKYFARGRLWASAEEARQAAEARRAKRAGGTGAPRGRDWRPGGEHRDPRQPFKDAKKAGNLARRRRRFDHRQRPPAAQTPSPDAPDPSRARPPRKPGTKPQGDPRRSAAPRGPSGGKPRGPAGRDRRGPGRPRGGR